MFFPTSVPVNLLHTIVFFAFTTKCGSVVLIAQSIHINLIPTSILCCILCWKHLHWSTHDREHVPMVHKGDNGRASNAQCVQCKKMRTH